MITRKTASYVLLRASQILPAERSPRSLSARLAPCHVEVVLRARRLGVVGAQDVLAVGQGALVQLDGLAKPPRRLGESGQVRVDGGELMSADENLLPAAGLDGGRARRRRRAWLQASLAGAAQVTKRGQDGLKNFLVSITVVVVASRSGSR